VAKIRALLAGFVTIDLRTGDHVSQANVLEPATDAYKKNDVWFEMLYRALRLQGRAYVSLAAFADRHLPPFSTAGLEPALFVNGAARMPYRSTFERCLRTASVSCRIAVQMTAFRPHELFRRDDGVRTSKLPSGGCRDLLYEIGERREFRVALRRSSSLPSRRK
jgi:hypothetical protein